MTEKEQDEFLRDQEGAAKQYFPFVGETVTIPAKTKYFDYEQWINDRLDMKNANG